MPSNASASSNSFLNESGAGSSSEAIATSPTGQTSSSSAEIFAPEGTFSRGDASATAFQDPPPETSASAEASGSTMNLNQNVSPIEPLNPVVTDPVAWTSSSSGELVNSTGAGSNQTSVVTDPIPSNSDNNSSPTSNSSGESVNIVGANQTSVVTDPIPSNGDNNSSPPSSSSGESANSAGAGSSSEASPTSPSGQTSSNGASTFDLTATSSSGSASEDASTQSPPVTEATASAPATTETNPTPEPPLNVMVVSPSDNPMMVGTASSDLIIGGTDNNRLFGNSGEDRLFGESGDDLVSGNQGDDTVSGGDGNDTLRGGKGNDWLNGGNGDDYLLGDFGVDTLIGGSGGDTFGLRTETVNPSADPRLADVIVDFNLAEGDRIALIGEVSLANIVLETIDFNGDGQINDAINPTTGADATLIKLGSNPEDGILAVVLGTVDATGSTILNIADFIIWLTHLLGVHLSHPNRTMTELTELSIEADEIVFYLKKNLQLKAVNQKILSQKIIEKAAQERGVTVTADEIQAEADRIRYEKKLEKASETLAWLADQMISPDEWEAGMRDRLLAKKLAETLFSQEVEKTFAQNKLDYEQILLYQIVVPYQKLAQELFYQIEEEEISFYEAAHLYDIDERRRRLCGYEGKLYRWGLKADIAPAIFSAQPGELIGPLASEQGYHIYLVEEFIPAELTPERSKEIIDKMFKQWLSGELNYVLHNQTDEETDLWIS